MWTVDFVACVGCSLPRLFTVLYFPVRSSRSSALRYGLPSCISVKTTVHLKIKIAVTERRDLSKRSHEKIGDCEQSTRYLVSWSFFRAPKAFQVTWPVRLGYTWPWSVKFYEWAHNNLSYSAQNLFQKLLTAVSLSTSCLSSRRSFSFPESSFAKDFVRLFESRVSTSWTPWTVSVN